MPSSIEGGADTGLPEDDPNLNQEEKDLTLDDLTPEEQLRVNVILEGGKGISQGEAIRIVRARRNIKGKPKEEE